MSAQGFSSSRTSCATGAHAWFERLAYAFKRRGLLRTAKIARAQAYVAYAEAKKRGDTRTVHYAAKALHAATNAVVRLELAK